MNIILPDDPEWREPVSMGNPYEKGLTPKTASEKRNRELDEMRDKDTNSNWKYANSTIAHAPDAFMKFAQMTGVNNMMTNPMWFSPLHTPQNWQIASKRREIYQWDCVSTSTSPCYIITCDYTCLPVSELEFSSKEVIEDTVTHGLLYENIESEPILAGKGVFRQPPKFAVRHHIEKDCREFSCYGYWRSLSTSAEHKMIVLDGQLYRHKKKIESNAVYRLKKGIPANRPKRVNISDKLVVRKQAQDVSNQDYLLAPVPKMGNEQMSLDRAWMLGLAVADGHVSQNRNEVHFTVGKHEKFRSYLEEKFSSFGKIRSKTHTSSKITQRITLCNKECHSFFAKYITGKLTEKCFTKELFDLSKESRLHVLGGYFDGDGSFSKAEGKLIANNYSCDMADQIYWLLLSVGIRASLGRYPLYGDHYETNSKWVYRIFIPQSDILKLKPYMRSNKIPDDFTPRNVRELRFFYEEDSVTYLSQPIESIKQFRHTGPGYDLQIDLERSFVASGFVTSNCRFFYENEPKVAAAIDFYSRFPMNGFDLVCKDKKINDWYHHHVVKRLDLNDMLKMMSSEYFMLGDVFVHLDVDCPVCQGSAVDPDTGEQCNHPGGSFKRMLILNPDWIEVQQSILADEPAIVMIPDEELKRIIFYKQPKTIYDRIPDNVKKLVLQNKPIPLSNRTLSHLKHMPVPYGTYGTSLIRRLFTTLAYKTKIMTANWIVAERLILPVRVVKIGSDNRPASSADIADIQMQLANTSNDPNLTIVTHHNFDYEWYGAAGKILQVTQEMEHIGKEILDGFMLNQSLLNGEMSGYQSAQVGVETLIRRIESWRGTLGEWIEENIFKPIAEMQGFIDEKASDELGETVFLYPTIKWNDLNLKDKNQWYQLLNSLHDKQVISTQTLLDEMDLDYDQEVQRMRYEMTQAGPAGGGLGAGAGAAPGMGGAPGGDMAGGMGGPGMGMPGGDMAGGMGMGDMGMAGGVGSGGMPGGGMGGMANAGGKVLKKGKSKAQQPDQEQMAEAMPMIKLTSIEQEMAQMLERVGATLGWNSPQIFDKIRLQFPVQNPKGNKPYMLDFALPQYGLGVECIHPDTLIPTDCGTKKASEVGDGDMLFGRLGDLVSISKFIRNYYDGDMLTIKAMGILPIQVTSNHPVLRSKKKRVLEYREMPSGNRNIGVETPDAPEFVDARELEVGDYLLIPKSRQCQHRQGQIITNPSQSTDLSVYNGTAHNSHKLGVVNKNRDLGWLIGIYAAEGCSHPNRSSIEFSFHKDETELVDKTSRLLDSFFGLKSKITIHDNVAKVRVCSRALARFLTSVVGIHAPEKRLASWVHLANDEFLFALLRGYLDGDGCIRDRGPEQGKWRLISSSPGLINDLQSIALSLGLWATAYQSRDAKMMNIQGRECESRGLWELSLMPSGNKNKHFREDESYYYVPIRSIKCDHYEGVVYNFETSGLEDSDHTYLVGNVITHNCDGEYFHTRPEQVQQDQERDHLLAQRGWTILRFDDKTIGDAPQQVESTILSYIKKATDGKKVASKKETSAHLYTMHKGEMVDIYGQYDKFLKQEYKIGHRDIPRWEDVKYKNDSGSTEMYK